MIESILSGLRVLDISTARGALCGKLLRDLGMDVIKVEPPDGDPLRHEPPLAEGRADPDRSLRFAYLNAGKRGITLDIARPEGRALFLDLVQRADVVLESHDPGVLDRLDLGYRTLSERWPRLVLVSLSGFGQSGPYSDYVAPDIVTTAMGGLLYISGDPSLPPCMPPETQSYYYASLFAAYGVVLALWQREARGVGTHIDASVQASLALHEHIVLNYTSEGKISKRAGSQHQQVAPANLFPCKDGYICIFVNQRHWPIFLEVWKDHPAELEEPRWISNAERRAHADWLNPLVAAFTSRYGKDDLADLLQKRGIPSLPVKTPREFMADPHVQERGFFASVDHPVLGKYRQPGAPFTVDGKRVPPAAAPTLGQHNSDIYSRELGIDQRRLEALAAHGVL